MFSEDLSCELERAHLDRGRDSYLNLRCDDTRKVSIQQKSEYWIRGPSSDQTDRGEGGRRGEDGQTIGLFSIFASLKFTNVTATTVL